MKLLPAAALLAVISAVAAPSLTIGPADGVTRVRVASDDCGTQPLKDDGTRWQCTFVDTFSGTTLDRTKWLPQTAMVTGGSTAHACYRDNPANVKVKNGALSLTLVKLDAPAPCGVGGVAPTVYQSGSVSTWHLFSQQYGRFQARLKTTATSNPGLHEAFWMWPDDRYGTTSPWPSSGEIDVAETFSVHPTVAVTAFHYSEDQRGLQPGLTMNSCNARRGFWNTYTLEWSPTKLEVFVNGNSCLVNTSGDIAFQKRYIMNFTQGIGPDDMDNRATSATRTPATLQVDYVRVWQ